MIRYIVSLQLEIRYTVLFATGDMLHSVIAIIDALYSAIATIDTLYSVITAQTALYSQDGTIVK